MAFHLAVTSGPGLVAGWGTVQFLMIHSPLLGPSSWVAVADAIRDKGHQTHLPDLRAAVTGDAPRTPMILAAAAAAAGAGPGSSILVAHSGAGLFLPGIADKVSPHVKGSIFVDAILPACDGGFTRWPSSVEVLDANTVDGMLRPWIEWWDRETMNRLLPDPRNRALLESDMPRVPRALYDEVVALPTDWCDGAAGYIQLSDAYRSEMNEALRRGWPTKELDATHLASITHPDLVATEIIRMAAGWP